MSEQQSTIRILHLDDNIYDLERVRQALIRPEGGQSPESTPTFLCDGVRSPKDLWRWLGDHGAPDLFLLDIHLDDRNGGEGISLLADLRRQAPGAAIVMRSNDDSHVTLARCFRGEADDFISKRTDRDELRLRLLKAIELRRFRTGAPAAAVPKGAIGRTMAAVAARVPRILQGAITAIHVTGETGTGKEVVADLFAAAIPPGVPMLRVNCGAIAPTLLESELFGHVKGAFTGATSDRIGLLEQADGGLIFLDEVASLSPTAQAAMLRALENHEVMRVGDRRPRKIRLRVLTATHLDMPAEVRAGRFREDLWQRLCEAVITLPPLRSRRDEIPALVEHFCRTMTGGPYQVTEPVLAVLKAHDWAGGNIRELRNTLRAMTEFQVNRTLTPLGIPQSVWKALDADPAAEGGTAGSPPPAGVIRLSHDWHLDQPMPFDQVTDRLLAQLVRELAAAGQGGSLRAIARATGIPRSTLAVRLRALVELDLLPQSIVTES